MVKQLRNCKSSQTKKWDSYHGEVKMEALYKYRVKQKMGLDIE